MSPRIWIILLTIIFVDGSFPNLINGGWQCGSYFRGQESSPERRRVRPAYSASEMPPQRRKEKHPRDRSGCGPKRVRAAPLLRKAHAAIIGRFVGRSLSSVRPCASLGRRRDAGKNARSLPPQQPLPGSSSRARHNELASPYAKQISICSGRTLGQFVNWGSLAIQLSFRLFTSLKTDSMVIPILSGPDSYS
jgi:hypothetical protein